MSSLLPKYITDPYAIILSQVPVSIEQGQLMIAELDKVISGGESAKTGSMTLEEFTLLAYEVIGQLQVYRANGDISTEQFTQLYCSITKLIAKISSSKGTTLQQEQTNNLIFYLILGLVLLVGYMTFNDKKGVSKILDIMHSMTIAILYVGGLALFGFSAWWFITTLMSNDYDVPATFAQMIADIIESLVEAVGDLLVELVSKLWSAVSGELKDLATDDSGNPEWYTYLNPPLMATYLYEVFSGEIQNPFSGGGGGSCRSPKLLRDILQAIVDVKMGLPISVKTTTPTTITSKYVF